MQSKHSLLFRLSVMFIILICLPVSAITAITVLHLRTSTAENIQKLNENSIAASSRSLEFIFEQCASITDTLVLSSEIRNIARASTITPKERLLNNRAFEQAVQNFLLQNESIQSIYLLSSDHILYQSNKQDNYWDVLAPLAAKQLEQYRVNSRDALEYHGLFIHPNGDDSTSVYLPTIFRPLYHPYNRKLLGVLVLELDPRLYSNTLNISSSPFFVLDPSDRIIFSNYVSQVGSPISAQFGGVDFRDHSLLTYCDTEYTVSYQSSSYGFTLLQLHDYHALTRGIWNSLLPLLFTSMICLFTFIVLSILFSRKMIRPIHQLQKSLHAMENGDLTHKVNIQSHDEIGSLAHSFNIMLDRLNLYIETAYREKLHTLDAEFRALQSQINPHFLYNSLESINSLALLHGEDQISEMTCALADMFRYVTAQSDPIVSVKQELIHVQNYLTLQNLRFNDHIIFDMDLDEAVLSCRIPKMSLQPLIENCFRHAWSSTIPILRITLSGIYDGEGYAISVIDNGCGISAEALQALRHTLTDSNPDSHRTSIGLCNINQRLQLLSHNSAYLTIDSTPGQGTTVTILLPQSL